MGGGGGALSPCSTRKIGAMAEASWTASNMPWGMRSAAARAGGGGSSWEDGPRSLDDAPRRPALRGCCHPDE